MLGLLLLGFGPALAPLQHCCVVQIEQVIIPSKKNDKPYSDYGFVHFKDRGSAVKLVDECEASENPRRLEFPPDSGTFLQVCETSPLCRACMRVCCVATCMDSI